MFKVGDEVVFLDLEKLTLDKGVVSTINEAYDYPVEVTLDCDNIMLTFTKKGFILKSNNIQQLYHKGTTLDFNPAPEPKRHPNLQLNDLVWVWNDSESREQALIRCFAEFTVQGKIRCFINGETNIRTIETTIWDNYEVVKNDYTNKRRSDHNA